MTAAPTMTYHKSRKRLAERLHELLALVPENATLTVEQHHIEYRTIRSQGGCELSYVIDRRFVLQPAVPWEGRNYQRQISKNKWSLDDGRGLIEVPYRILWEIAKALPAAVLRYRNTKPTPNHDH